MASQIFVASDHAGFSLKKNLIEKNKNYDWKDLGCPNADRVDYPDYAQLLCQKVVAKPGSFGVLICGSGQGMAMSANRHAHIRAALCWNVESAQLARQHNDANVLCLGARLIDESTCHEILKAFLQTEFEGGRHQARVEKIDQQK